MEHGVRTQVTRAEKWEGNLKMDYNTAIAVVTDSKRQCRYCLIELANLLNTL